MKKLILIFILSFSGILLYSQKPITSGMTGTQVRETINTNFDSLYDGTATVFSSINNFVSVMDYGAVGNGIVDDRAAIVAASTVALARQATLLFPTGTYSISSSISINLTDKHMSMQGAGKVTIWATGGNDYFIFTSSPGSYYHFKSIPEIGRDYVVVKTLYGLVTAGDLLSIESSEHPANDGISSGKKGELVVVQNIANDTIYLQTPLFDYYDTTTTTIRNLKSGSIHLENINFTDITVQLNYLKNSTVRDCNWMNPWSMALSIMSSRYVDIRNNNIERSGNHPELSAYGVSIGGSQNINFTYNNISNYRQAIAAGGSFPCRQLVYDHNTVRGSAGTGGDMDTHTLVQYSTISNNVIYDGGIYAGGEYVDIIDNTIIFGRPRNVATGIIRFREDLSNTIGHPQKYSREETISGNRIIHNTTNPYIGGDNSRGIMVTFGTYRDIINTITIKDNYIDVGGYGIMIYADNPTDDAVLTLNVINNYVHTIGAESTQALRIPPNAGDYQYINIIGNEFVNDSYQPMYIAINPDHVLLSENIIRGLYAQPSYIRGTGEYVFRNNTFITSPINIPYEAGGLIEMNKFVGFTAGQTAIYAGSDVNYPTDTIIIRNNQYFGGCKTCVSTVMYNNTFVYETKQLAGALTDGAPTNAEINTICGATAATLLKGYKLIIKDTNGTGLTYIVISDGTDWILQGVPVKAV